MAGPFGNPSKVLRDFMLWIRQLQKYVCGLYICGVRVLVFGRLIVGTLHILRHTGVNDPTFSMKKVESQ